MPSGSGRRESASAIVADKERGCHELKVYASSLAVAAPAGAGGLLTSSPFTVGGHRWRVRYYPNGDCAKSAGLVSIYLGLDEDVAKPVIVQYRFSIVVEKRALFFIKMKEEVSFKPEALQDFSSQNSCCGYTTFAKRKDLSKLMRRHNVDAFTIRCDLAVHNGFRAPAAAPKARVPPSDLSKHLGELLQSGRGADVVFEVGGERFAALRCVLAARSPVISAELLGDSEGAAATEAGVVRVDGVEPRAFKALLY